MNDQSLVVLRPYNSDTDAALLYATWRNSLWYDQRRDPNESDAYYRMSNKVIKTLLSQPTTTVKIACLSDDPNLIIGYAVLTGTNLEFVYVKIDYRNKGVAHLLCKGFVTVTQPQTKIGLAIAKDHDLKLKEPNVQE